MTLQPRLFYQLKLKIHYCNNDKWRPFYDYTDIFQMSFKLVLGTVRLCKQCPTGRPAARQSASFRDGCTCGSIIDI